VTSLASPTYDWALELGLKTHKVTNVSTDERLLALPSKVVPESIRCGRGSIAERISACALRGVVSSDRVGDGVSDFKVIRKGAGCDLVVIGWVTPSTEPARRGVVEDGCIGEICTGIYEMGHQDMQEPGIPRVGWNRLT
jgi:hypothetical protein